jgi:two-component system, chemotaxis family, response regulator Rcp1
MRYKPLHILLVDDDPAQAGLMAEALRFNDIPYELSVAETACDALDFAFGRGMHRDAKRPDIVVLDLKLGPDSGHDVLKELKSDPTTHCIPVIVMSSSAAQRDIQEAYGAYANCYVHKPFLIGDFIEVIRGMENFWANVAVLPRC